MAAFLSRFSVAAMACALLLLIPHPATAQLDEMCDPAWQDCRARLIGFINRETDSIDVAMWFMEDQELANTIINRFKAGVEVRALVDPRRNPTTPMNAVILDMFQAAGIPMRYKVGGGILHWKYMIFNGQGALQFSAANYGDYYFKPAVPYLDYTDEGIYFTGDQPVVNSFRRKFDDSWVDTVGFAHYANITGTPLRAYPLYAIDPTVSFVPAENFATRSKPLYDAETQKIDVIMYKITEPIHADGLIRAAGRGVPVRLIVEPERYRNPENVWNAYHMDRLFMAGVKMRQRAHKGFLHQKSTILYGQGLTVFGSSNWSNESNKSQYEHNYFTTKTWFFNWFVDNFERKWTNRTGNAETEPFVPLPPDAPVYVGPANGAVNVSTTTTVAISWKPGPWAHKADIYFGTSSNPPLVSSRSHSPSSTQSYTLPTLAAGTRYYWRIVSKTMALKEASGPIYSFTTAGSTPAPDPEPEPEPPPPPPPSGSDIVLHTAHASAIAGAWRLEADTTAASGKRMRHPNAGAAKVTTPLASPANYFEMTFTADAGVGYRLWMRGKADSNVYSNDSVHVQFSQSVNSSGTAVYRIGTATATEYNLESCSGCGLSGWGWQDNGYGTGVLGPLIYFSASGTQKIRIQTREDGLAIDQIVLSRQTYLTSAPGPTKNDTTILPATSGSTSPPPPTTSTGEVVLYAGEATKLVGTWQIVADAAAAGGKRIWNPNAGAAKVLAPSATPSSYFEMTFNAVAGKPYRLWIRAKADSNSYANDSVHVQFSGSVNSSGTAVYRIGTTAGTEFNLESCSGCGLSGWGWEDNGWGTGVLGPVIYFSTTGTQTIRIQPREDGVSIDQIILSPQKYLTTSPGATKNDTVIVPKG